MQNNSGSLKYLRLREPCQVFIFIRSGKLSDLHRERDLNVPFRTVSQDGPVNYMREDFKEMSEEVFQEFLRYHFTVCERKDLLGASCHVVDILEKRPLLRPGILLA